MVFKQKTTIVVLLVFLAYFLLRTINLTALPIFNDESTYIRYGLHQLKEPNHQPYSLLIGKEPLDPYLYALFGTMIGNLLIGGRLVTIAFGFLTLIGLYLFTKTLFDKRVALFTSILYVIAPYTVFFDRLALLDSSVSTVAVWSLYLTDRLLHKAQWRYALALGAVMGIGLWIKTSTLFYIFLPIISYAVYYFLNGDKRFAKATHFFVALILSLVIFLPLFSNPFYAIHMQLLRQYTYPLSFVFSFPFSVWWTNITSLFTWLFFYLTPPLFLLAASSLIAFSRRKKILLVLLWFYLPFVYEVLYAKLFASRHVLLLTIPLFILAGYGFSLLLQRKKKLGITLGAVILVWCFSYNSILLMAPARYSSVFAGKAQEDMSQYVNGFSSGYGVSEAVNYLEQIASGHRIIVLIRNDHGNPEDAVVAYLDYQSNIIVLPSSNPAADVPIIFQKVGTDIPVYFVARGNNNGGLEKYFAEEKKFLKPNDADFVGVVQLIQNVQ